MSMQILVLIGTVGASPQIGEILPPCDFFDCPFFSRERAQMEPLNRFSRFMRQMSNVFLRKDGPFGGQNDG